MINMHKKIFIFLSLIIISFINASPIVDIENVRQSGEIGTFKNEDKILANGGRVLNFVSLSDSFEKARNDIHQNINKLKWDKGFYRRDIAFKVIS